MLRERERAVLERAEMEQREARQQIQRLEEILMRAIQEKEQLEIRLYRRS
jgi:hypothetical protein